MILARRSVMVLAASVTLGCFGDDPIAPPIDSPALAVLGNGLVTDRYTGEVWVNGNIAYTTSWGFRQAPGNAIKIWDVAGDVPLLVNTVVVPNASTLGDIQTSDDGQLLIVATEYAPDGSILIYSLADPVNPQLITRYATALTMPGVHTAEVQRVAGKLYAFLSVDPGSGSAARLVIVDLSDPAAPAQVFTAVMGAPFVHDVFVRDGILVTALWDDGITVWDIGGAGSGSVSNPIPLGSLATVGGQVHNVWWYQRTAPGQTPYIFVGQEGPGAVGSFSSGDIHVVDASNFAALREVAFFHVDGAGTHNFSLDETRGILYAAYYNGGVRAIDVTGDLSSCDAADRSPDGRCDLARMGRELAHGLVEEGQPVYVWGVQLSGGRLYASDMLNGIWKLAQASFPPD
jgi:LVIVD repeat-containing protein